MDPVEELQKKEAEKAEALFKKFQEKRKQQIPGRNIR
jgi:hypothetical protein